MRFKVFSGTLGLFLIAFGFSLQPVHSDSKHFVPNKKQLKSRVKAPNLSELRQSLRRFMNPQEKKLYNQVRHISADTTLSVQERVDKIIELSETPKLTQANKGMILNGAVTLAQNGLEGEEREEVLKKLNNKNPQAKWFLKENPNPNLLKLSKLQYSILMGSEDI